MTAMTPREAACVVLAQERGAGYSRVCSNCGTGPCEFRPVPDHTVESDFRHFLACTSLGLEPPEVIDKLRTAYIHGAERRKSMRAALLARRAWLGG